MKAQPYTGTHSLAEDQVRFSGDERRASSRSTSYHAEGLLVEPEMLKQSPAAVAPPHAGVGARLADLSETGIGLLLLAPLRVNAEVDLTVDLYHDGAGEELKAHAQIVHCRAGDDGSYRVGLAFRSVDCRPLDTTYYPDLARIFPHEAREGGVG